MRRARTANLLLTALLLAPFAATRSRADLPPLIPRDVLFGNPEKAGPQLSPDGKRLAWLAPDAKNVLQVWVETVGEKGPGLCRGRTSMAFVCTTRTRAAAKVRPTRSSVSMLRGRDKPRNRGRSTQSPLGCVTW